MSKLTAFVICLMLATGVAHPAQKAGHLHLRLVAADGSPLDGQTVEGGRTLWSGDEMTGVVYFGGNGLGMLVNSVLMSVGDIDWEVNYALLFDVGKTDTTLVGSLRFLRYSPEGDVVGGRKIDVKQSLHMNHRILIPLGYEFEGKPLALAIELMEKSPIAAKSDQGGLASPLFLSSTQLIGEGTGGSYSYELYRLKDTNEIQAEFSLNLPDGTFECLKYEVSMTLSPPVGDQNDYGQTRLIYSRKYIIDTMCVEFESFGPDVTYNSSYEKDVVLDPGGVIQLVFPPDTPSVRGFDIEDTLIVRRP